MKRDDEFFVGYLPPPPGTGLRMRRVAIGLAAAVGLCAVLIAVSQGPFPRASFDWQHAGEARGRIERAPYPVLVEEDGAVPLAAPGKHGADALVAGLDGREVALRGKRIERAGTTMLEVEPGSIRAGDAVPAGPSEEDLGVVTLTGEIVDSKCFLGVMNPGSLETHRACAIRCISGGVPPMLFVRDRDGAEAHVLLVSKEGHAVNREVLDLVARPVTIVGRLVRRDGLYYLYSDPATYGRVIVPEPRGPS